MIYYCSDLHIGHTRIAHLRGFAHADTWENYVFDELARLKRDDVLYILGDLAFGKAATDRTYDKLAALKIRQINLTWGNHDLGRPSSRHPNKRLTRRAYDTFTLADSILSRSVNKTRVLLSHYPYDTVPSQHPDDETNLDTDEIPSRRLLRLHDFGLPLVHGHVHTEALHLLPYTYNVCYEATGKLLTSEIEIEDWLHTLNA